MTAPRKSRARRRYSEEFKREAVAMIQQSSLPATPISAELGVSTAVLYRWQREFKDNDMLSNRPTYEELARYRVIATCRSPYPISRMCSLLGTTKSLYYAWEQRGQESTRAPGNRRLRVLIRSVHRRSGKKFGYRRGAGVAVAARRELSGAFASTPAFSRCESNRSEYPRSAAARFFCVKAECGLDHRHYRVQDGSR